jgi:hypothetical protein
MQASPTSPTALLGGTILVALVDCGRRCRTWTVAVLRPWEPRFPCARLLRRTLGFVALGAVGLALAQAADLGVKALLLVDRIEMPPSSRASPRRSRREPGRLGFWPPVALAVAALALRARPASRTLLAVVVVSWPAS